MPLIPDTRLRAINSVWLAELCERINVLESGTYTLGDPAQLFITAVTYSTLHIAQGGNTYQIRTKDDGELLTTYTVAALPSGFVGSNIPSVGPNGNVWVFGVYKPGGDTDRDFEIYVRQYHAETGAVVSESYIDHTVEARTSFGIPASEYGRFFRTVLLGNQDTSADFYLVHDAVWDEPGTAYFGGVFITKIGGGGTESGFGGISDTIGNVFSARASRANSSHVYVAYKDGFNNFFMEVRTWLDVFVRTVAALPHTQSDLDHMGFGQGNDPEVDPEVYDEDGVLITDIDLPTGYTAYSSSIDLDGAADEYFYTGEVGVDDNAGLIVVADASDGSFKREFGPYVPVFPYPITEWFRYKPGIDDPEDPELRESAGTFPSQGEFLEFDDNTRYFLHDGNLRDWRKALQDLCEHYLDPDDDPWTIETLYAAAANDDVGQPLWVGDENPKTTFVGAAPRIFHPGSAIAEIEAMIVMLEASERVNP